MANGKNPHNYISEQTFSLLGLDTESMGKTQARQEFLPLVADLKKHPRAIEITDRNDSVAVILSYDHYAALVSRLAKSTKKPIGKMSNLMGSVIIHGDLEAASKEIAKEFEEAIERSAAALRE